MAPTITPVWISMAPTIDVGDRDLSAHKGFSPS